MYSWSWLKHGLHWRVCIYGNVHICIEYMKMCLDQTCKADRSYREPKSLRQDIMYVSICRSSPRPRHSDIATASCCQIMKSTLHKVSRCCFKSCVLNVLTRYQGKERRKQLGNGWLTPKPQNRAQQYWEKGYHGRYRMGYCGGAHTQDVVYHMEGKWGGGDCSTKRSVNSSSLHCEALNLKNHPWVSGLSGSWDPGQDGLPVKDAKKLQCLLSRCYYRLQ